MNEWLCCNTVCVFVCMGICVCVCLCVWASVCVCVFAFPGLHKPDHVFTGAHETENLVQAITTLQTHTCACTHAQAHAHTHTHARTHTETQQEIPVRRHGLLLKF